MSDPRITIVLPHRNQVGFLAERFGSILGQTVGDWEVVVVDGESSDGGWEVIQGWVARDRRIRAMQAPARGPYEAWNRGIAEARGEFVCIATADDTMAPDFLEKMVGVLDRHRECGMAQCGLEIIDAEGKPVAGDGSWREQPVQKFYLKGLLDVPHLRLAPHDGFLHAATGTVYTSITQLLIRREVFERVGMFRIDAGSIADFEWGMRASLLVSTVYWPEMLATWRRHPAQATSDARNATAANRREMAALVERAVVAACEIEPRLEGRVDGRRLARLFRHQAWLFERQELGGRFTPFLQWLREPDLIGIDLQNRFLWRNRFHRLYLDWIRREMAAQGVALPTET